MDRRRHVLTDSVLGGQGPPPTQRPWGRWLRVAMGRPVAPASNPTPATAASRTASNGWAGSGPPRAPVSVVAAIDNPRSPHPMAIGHLLPRPGRPTKRAKSPREQLERAPAGGPSPSARPTGDFGPGARRGVRPPSRANALWCWGLCAGNGAACRALRQASGGAEARAAPKRTAPDRGRARRDCLGRRCPGARADQWAAGTG
jgi:hypothetical protein